MTLQFQAPPDWLVQGYLNRQNPVVEGLQGVQGVMQQYAQQKSLQQQQALAQQSKDIEMAKELSSGGQDFQAALDQIKAGRNAPVVQGSSLIDRAKAFFTGSKTGASPDTTTATPGSPELPSPVQNPETIPGYNQNSTAMQADMAPAYASAGTSDVPTSGPLTDPLVQEYQRDPVAFKRQHGTRGIEKLSTQVGIDKNLLQKPEDKYYTTDQATNLLKNNPSSASAIASFPKDKVPRDAVHLMMSSGNQPRNMGNTEWDSATPGMKSTAKALYEGRIRPSDVFRERGLIIQLAEEYANRNGLPAFKAYAGDINAAMGKYSTSGKMGQNATSLNTALGHANSALEAYQNVANTNERFLNVPINKLRAQTNDPNVLKLQTTLNALSGELANTFKNSSGTDQEIGHWMNVLNEDLTPKQAVGVIQQVNDLLNSRLGALEYQRGNTGGGSLLSPHGKELSQKLSGQNGTSTGKSFIKPGEEAEYEAYKRSMAGGQ